MTKINWNRNNKVYDGIVHTNKKSKNKDIDLGIHETHKLQVLIANKPHNGKLICKDCNKFIKWLSEYEFKRLNRL